jgi:APA family basic amino acid/polyamine antiporter
MVGCVYLYVSLPVDAMLVLPGWGAIGLLLYFAYGFRHSHVARGIVDMPEESADAPPMAVLPMPGAPAPGSHGG